jgi:hypothetical protein
MSTKSDVMRAIGPAKAFLFISLNAEGQHDAVLEAEAKDLLKLVGLIDVVKQGAIDQWRVTQGGGQAISLGPTAQVQVPPLDGGET